MNRPYCLIGLLLLLLPILTQAQQQNSAPVSHFPFRIYTAKDGLSQTLVHQIVQDTFGYIWTGGREGINRFDGLNFINHRIDSTYPDDVIRFSYFFPPNQIWMAGNNGIYSINKDSISNYLPESGEMLNHASSIFLSHRNSVCVKQKKENSYSILEFKDGEFSRASDLEKLLDNYYKWKYIPDEGGYLGVEANFSDTLNYFSLYFTSTDGKRILIQSGTFPRQFPPPTVLVKKGNTYVKINHTIYKFQNKKLTRPITIGEGFKHFEVRNEEFIFHNDSAVFKWNGEKIIDYGLRLPAIYQIFLDREERLWISCETGLVKVTSEAIRVYPQNRGCPPNVWTVLEDNNAVFWLGTFRNGVHTYSPQTNRYQNRPLITSYLNENTPYYFDHFYPGALMDSTGNLIFPTASRVISISNGIPKILDLPYLGSSACQGLKERDGEFLVATKGFIRVKKDGSKEFYGQKDGLNMNRLSYFETIERDTQGHYWLGSHNGLVFADLEKKSFKHYYVGKDIHAGINTIAQTPDHRLWFGSHNGLMLYDYTSKLPQRILQKEITESIKTIEYLPDNKILLGALDKAILLDLDKFEAGQPCLQRITDETGFKGEDCIQHGSFTDSEYNVWLPTRTELLQFIPSAFSATYPRLHTEITTVSALQQGKEVLHKKTNSLVAKDLRSTQQIRINFHTVDHYKPEAITYQHKFETDENWSIPSQLRFAQFANLNPGSYTFTVRACLEDECFSPSQLSLNISPGHWTHTLLFKTSRILFIVFLLGFLAWSWMRKNRKEKEAEILQLRLDRETANQVKLQQKLFITQSNPHFVFNALNSIIGQMAVSDKDSGISYLSDFGELFRVVLSDNESFLHTLYKEIEVINQYLRLEKLRFGDRFEYKVNIDKDVKQSTLIPKLFVQSFVNNAIKHGIEPLKKGGKLTINISSDKKNLYFSIRDNGPGINFTRNSDPDGGQGIQIARSTIDWIKTQSSSTAAFQIQDLQDSNNPSNGTKVLICLPLDLKLINDENI